jgi:hypothetical protein
VDAGLGVAVGEGVEDGGLTGEGKSNDAQVQARTLQKLERACFADLAPA